MAIKNLNVTIGASATALIASGSIRCNWATFINRDASDMAVGGSDVTTGSQGKGIPLAAGGGFNYQSRAYIAQTNLALWYVAGTQNQIVSLVYDDGVDNLP